MADFLVKRPFYFEGVDYTPGQTVKDDLFAEHPPVLEALKAKGAIVDPPKPEKAEKPAPAAK